MNENIEALERLIRVAGIGSGLNVSRPTVMEDALKAIEELKIRQSKLMTICSQAEAEIDDGWCRIYPFQIKEALGKL